MPDFKKKDQVKKKYSLKEIQAHLEEFEKDTMIDDHGSMVVGLRGKKPVQVDDKP